MASSPSSAYLYVDGTYRALTPYNVSGLSVGNHNIQVSNLGYNDYTTIKYTYAGNNSLSVILTPVTTTTTTIPPINQTASLFVASSPSSAYLYVDGTYRALTPYNVSGLSVGNHNLQVSMIGYNDYTTIKYTYAGNNSLNVALTPVTTTTTTTSTTTTIPPPTNQTNTTTTNQTNTTI